MSVGVVLLNYSDVETALAACRRFASFEIVGVVVLVDNASPDGSWQRMLGADVARDARVILVRSPSNTGYGTGNNLGIEQCLNLGVDQVLVVNPDVVLLEPELTALVGRLSDASLGCVSPVLVQGDPPVVDCLGGLWDAHWGRGIQYGAGTRYEGVLTPLRWPPRVTSRFRPTPSGACLLFTAEAITALGLLPQDTFLFGEEVLLAEKARRLGIGIVVDLAIPAVHDRGRTTGSARSVEERSPTAFYHSARSSVIVAAALWPRRRCAYLAARLLWAVRLAGRRRQAATATARGACAGLPAGRRARYLSLPRWRPGGEPTGGAAA